MTYNPREFIIQKGILTKYIGKGSKVVIPQGVTAIGKDAFARCEKLSEVTVPDSVTSVGASAFYQCKRLNAIRLPASIKAIGEYAFFECTDLSAIDIPRGIRSLNRSVFEGCRSLTQVTLPESVVSIGYGAFSGCIELRSVTIPESVTTLGQFAFSRCQQLTQISLPESVTTVSSYAFCDCWALVHFTFPHKIKIISESVLERCVSLQSVSLPNGIISIGKNAFTGCQALQRISFPSGVASIGQGAFWACNALREVTIPETVTAIGMHAFAHCKALEQIRMPEHIQGSTDLIRSIVAQSRCLQRIFAPGVLPQQLEDDHAIAAALGYLSDPEAYRNPQNAEEYKRFIRSKKSQISIAIFKLDLSACLPVFMQTVKVPSKQFDKVLLQPAFERNATQCVAFLMEWKNSHNTGWSPLDQLELDLTEDPFSVEQLRKFWSYQKLPEGSVCITSYKGDDLSIQIPERIGTAPVTAIGEEAFSAFKKTRTRERRDVMEQIEHIMIPEGVTSIGTLAFFGCVQLHTISIPETVTCISPSAFQNCRPAILGIPNSYAQHYAREHTMLFIPT